MSRSTWACELKLREIHLNPNFARHAPRERVSWNNKEIDITYLIHCHAPRERVSWNDSKTIAVCCFDGHAPRERVSWNSGLMGAVSPLHVTLHVSVWVEMHKKKRLANQE